MTADDYLSGLGFRPDPFQIEAATALTEGHSVVVTAPTGAGKTVVAETAVHLALESGTRAFYTTPIKALSNQKFGDFRATYGDDDVGLLTGDNVVNGDAPIVVMTTEVLRNMIYADSAALEGLGVVILDEVHYLQDPFRGSVWEEVIIHLPARIRLVCLSATIANPEEFTAWVRARRGPTDLVVEVHRPVPLESLYMVKDRHRDGAVEVYPVFAGKQLRPNQHVVKLLNKGRGRFRRFAWPRRWEVVQILQQERLLPAIYFVFSRAGCEQAAGQIAAERLGLTTHEQRVEIQRRTAERTAHLHPSDLTVLGYERWLTWLEEGVAAHHAGMVPAFKETVEDLFAAGLLSVVFATETLALGINMPARSVVLERLSKFTGESHELLQPGDYTQLTGRAGRRGIDDAGTAIVLHSPQVPFDKVAAIAAAGSHQLRSSFQPSYNMAVNLIANYTRDEAETLLNASFAQFRASRRRDELTEALERARGDLEDARRMALCSKGDVSALLDAPGRALPRSPRDVMEAFARSLTAGSVVDLGVEGSRDRRVLLARGYGTSPRLLFLAEGGDLSRVRPTEVPVTAAWIGSIDLPEPFLPRDPGYQSTVATDLREWQPTAPARPAYADDAPLPDGAASCPRLSEHLDWSRKAVKLERQVARLARRMDRGDQGLVDRFRAILGLLDRWGYTDGWKLTVKGQWLRFVYTELDLIAVESVSRGLLDGLTAGDLAAVASLFVYESRLDDEAGDWPSKAAAVSGDGVLEIGDELAVLEREMGLPESRPADPGFAEAAYNWAVGIELEDMFDDEDIRAGDFVRNCRQLLDLLRQLRDAFPAVAEAARQAIRSIDRGIVAAGGLE